MAKKCEMLQPSPDTPTVILDMFGFDAWPGSYAISQAARGSLECNSFSKSSMFSCCSCIQSACGESNFWFFLNLIKSHLRQKDCVCYGVSREVNCDLC